MTPVKLALSELERRGVGELAAGRCRVYLARIEAARSAELRETWLGCLSPAEHARLGQLSGERKRNYLAARAFLRTLVAAHEGVAVPRLELRENAWGKPELLSRSAARLGFNLSHSGEYVACAIAPGFDVGIDLEKISRRVSFTTVAERCFSRAELAGLERLDPADRSARFFALWTLKEAYVKACGLGVAVPLERLSFSFGSGSGDVAIEFEPPFDDDAASWQFCRLALLPGYEIAVAMRRDRESDLLIDVCEVDLGA